MFWSKLYKNTTLTKIARFSNTFHYTKFQGCITSKTSVTPTSEKSACLSTKITLTANEKVKEWSEL